MSLVAIRWLSNTTRIPTGGFCSISAQRTRMSLIWWSGILGLGVLSESTTLCLGEGSRGLRRISNLRGFTIGILRKRWSISVFRLIRSCRQVCSRGGCYPSLYLVTMSFPPMTLTRVNLVSHWSQHLGNSARNPKGTLSKITNHDTISSCPFSHFGTTVMCVPLYGLFIQHRLLTIRMK